MTKTYGQFCGLARALDHIGDRWTLLIVRELLVGPATYGELHQGLGTVPTNLLAERLRQLEADGLVVRERDDHDRRRVRYGLTADGAALEETVLALVRWGARFMRSGPGGDEFQPRWAVLALRAVLSARRAPVSGLVEIGIGPDRVTVIGRSARPIRVERGPAATADARVTGSPEALLALVDGLIDWRTARQQGLEVSGVEPVAEQLLVAPGTPG